MSPVTVGDIERAVAKAFPPEWAEEWDRVGLLAGDPERVVTGVTLALDPTRSAVKATADNGSNVLLTHHPAFLKTPNWLTPGRGSAGVVFSAMDSRVALINAHTNLDRAPGAGELLPTALGLRPVKPIERSLMPMTLVTVFVPSTHAQRVADAMAGAGGGRVGDYEGASFTSAAGKAAFVPGSSTSPFLGEPGQPATADEVRVEMVAPRAKARGVVGAARGAHPYEEPLIVAADVVIARSSARMGMLCRAPEELTLAELAKLAASTFGVVPRIWGDPDARIARVATATGSAGSLVGDVIASGATALVAGEVRYHDALDAVESGLAIVELGHDVSEWPLVALLKDAILALPGLDSGDRARPAGHTRLVDTLKENRMTQAGSLLELQALDLEVLRSNKKLEELPEKHAILAARAKLREVTVLHGKADLLVAKLQSDLKAHQDEIEMLTVKIAAEQTKVMATTDHRAVTSITREMDGLKRRQDKLEMESLQLMERVDKAKAQIATIDDALAQLTEKEAALIAQFREVGGALQKHIAQAERKRATVAKSLPADLVKRYEAARESKGGVGVGELDGEACTACRMVLPAERVRELASGPPIGICPQCRRLIVVHPAGSDE